MDHIEKSYPRRLARLLPSLAIGVALLGFTAMPPAHADDKEDACKHRIEQANHKLHDAIDHHGATSSQADHARHDLQEAREQCWRENHKWWDDDEHRWHDQQDWDDHDHNH
jgi:hypothetical protein